MNWEIDSTLFNRRRRLDERFNSGGDLRSRLGARRGSGGRRRGSGDGDSLEREDLDVDLRAELTKKRGMQIEVRGDGKRRGKVKFSNYVEELSIIVSVYFQKTVKHTTTDWAWQSDSSRST